MERDGHRSNAQICFLARQAFFEKYPSCLHIPDMREGLDDSGCCKVEICREMMAGSICVPAHEPDFASVSFGFYLFTASEASQSMLCIIEDQPAVQKLWPVVQEKRDCFMSADLCLLELIEAFSKDDILYLQRMEKELGLLEDALMKGSAMSFSRKFLYYRRKLSVFHYYYEQMLDLGESLQAEYGKREQEDLRLEWEQFSSRMERFHDYVNYLREYIIQLRDLYHTQIDDRQNRGINFLTLVTSLFLPLTLLTGWYGMNFEYMPEVTWKYGYLMVIGVAFLIIIAEVIYIRTKKIL